MDKIIKKNKDIETEVGDVKQPDFKPQLKIKKWDNEVNFSIRAEEKADAVTVQEDEKTKYKTKDYEVHQYEVPAGEDGGYEFEWVLLKKPKSNVLMATIQTKGLDFYYQPELTPKEIEDGCSRPENVIGSYAVYYNKKNNKYKTGKAFHIYRPKAIDAKGDETWCELNINIGLGVLTVTVPDKWLKKASYPVVVDPTFGYTSIGASEYSIGSSSLYNPPGLLGTLPANGDISKITVHTVATVGDAGTTCILYAGSAGSRGSSLATTNSNSVGTSYSWVDFTFASPYSATADTYWLHFNGDGANGPGGNVDNIHYDSGGATNTGYTLDDLGEPTYNTNQYSIYATYTETGQVIGPFPTFFKQ